MTFIFALFTVFYLGLLSSFSPCPLATNLIAFSFITQHAYSKKKSAFVAFIYAFGRSLTYALLGFLLIGGMFTSSYISHFLQKYMNLFLGPILLIVSLFLLKLIPIPTWSKLFRVNQKTKWLNTPTVGALSLGVFFALSFCPVTAVIFFGSVIPIALETQSIFLIPLTFGVSSSLPVLFFAFIAIFCAQKTTKFYEKIVFIEPKLHFFTALLFLFIGFYMTLTQSMQISIF